MKSTIDIKEISITALDTDAIVNAANEQLAAGGGVCGAIFDAAGYAKLQKACDKIGHCPTGKAVITPGFALKAKYVVHAVGPVWKDGQHGEPEKLRSAYKNALQLAVDNHCTSIGFPLISAGIYGYPEQRAWSDAMVACKQFLDEDPDEELHITFAVINHETYKNGVKALRTAAAEYKIADKSDWKTEEMPAVRDAFVLTRRFTAEQMDALRRGNIPKGMEDKWFRYMSGNTLYAHRSWTGNCIYIIDFNDDDNHQVIVNRDAEQYSCSSVDEDRIRLNELLDRWSKPNYDYYNEWLSETAEMLNKKE